MESGWGVEESWSRLQIEAAGRRTGADAGALGATDSCGVGERGRRRSK